MELPIKEVERRVRKIKVRLIVRKPKDVYAIIRYFITSGLQRINESPIDQ